MDVPTGFHVADIMQCVYKSNSHETVEVGDIREQICRVDDPCEASISYTAYYPGMKNRGHENSFQRCFNHKSFQMIDFDLIEK